MDGARSVATSAVDRVRQQVADAVVGGSATQLQDALAEAQRYGLHGTEVRRARDALIALEAHDFRRRADIVVEEAIESDDWWKLQAAMQTVVGSGLGSEQSGRLQEAMRTHKRRQEAARELQTAAQARDPAKLRTAIELALKAHVKEPLVKRARDDLRSLEARLAAMEQLRKATTSGDVDAIKAAIEATERTGFNHQEERSMLDAAKREVQAGKLAHLERLHKAQDHNALERELAGASSHFLKDGHVAEYTEKIEQLRTQDQCRQQLQQAVQAADKNRLVAALRNAEATGLRDVAEVQSARDALQAMETREKQVYSRQQAGRELQAALQFEDANRLSAALHAAEQAGVAGQEAAPARERLRFLRSKTGAAQELQDAMQAGDVYRLRAALATARGAGVCEAEVQRARDSLRVIEGHAHAKRSLEAACKSRDPHLLQRAIESARQAGLPKRDVAHAEAELRAFGNSQVALELRAATADGGLERLKAAAQAAGDAGLFGPEVDAAWERIRQLESNQWLRKQLQGAIASGDSARLQAAIRQAELAGFGGDPEVAAARAELESRNARLHARQELQLARAGANPYALLAAIRAAQAAGLPVEELEAARVDLQRLDPHGVAGGGPVGPPTDPQVFTAPITDPQLQAPPSAMTAPMTNPRFQAPPTDPQPPPPPPYHGEGKTGRTQRVTWAVA